jgi:hypothetical protein
VIPPANVSACWDFVEEPIRPFEAFALLSTGANVDESESVDIVARAAVQDVLKLPPISAIYTVAYAPPPQEIIPPPQEIILPPQEIIPLPQEIIPPPQEIIPLPQEIIPGVATRLVKLASGWQIWGIGKGLYRVGIMTIPGSWGKYNRASLILIGAHGGDISIGGSYLLQDQQLNRFWHV